MDRRGFFASIGAFALACIIPLPKAPTPTLALPMQGSVYIDRARGYAEVRTYKDGKLVKQWRGRIRGSTWTTPPAEVGNE